MVTVHFWQTSLPPISKTAKRKYAKRPHWEKQNEGIWKIAEVAAAKCISADF